MSLYIRLHLKRMGIGSRIGVDLFEISHLALVVIIFWIAIKFSVTFSSHRL